MMRATAFRDLLAGSGRVVRSLAAAGISMLAVGLVLAPSHAVCDDSEILEQIKDAWRAQKSEIQTARVRIRQLLRSTPKATMNWEDAEVAFAELDRVEATGDDDAMRDAVTRCVKAICGPSAGYGWPVRTIIVEGKNIRNTVEVGDRVAQDWNYNQGTSVKFRAPEVSVDSGRPGVAIYGISYLRPVPESEAEWRILPEQSAETIWLDHTETAYSVRVAIDKKTRVSRRISTPRSALEIRGALAEYEGGVVMPGYAVRLTFRGGKVNALNAFIVEHAVFNSQVSPNDLSVSVPKGTRVHDKRNPDRERFGVAKVSGDAVLLADRLPGPRSYFSPLRFLAFVVALIAGVVFAASGVRKLLIGTPRN